MGLSPLEDGNVLSGTIRDQSELFGILLRIRDMGLELMSVTHDPARVIGSCGYFSVRRGTQTYEIGYELHPDYWCRGLMTEALPAILRFGFDPQARLPVHRTEALVIPDHGASIRVLEKLGFSCEGVRREFGFWKERYHDVALYARLSQG